MRVLTLVLVLAAAFAAPAARACGVSTADGLSSCSLEEHEEETRPRWRAGAAGLATSTAIDFGAFRSDETRGSVIASLAYQPTRRLTVQLAAGSTIGGHLDTAAGVYEFSPGPTVATGASYRLVQGTRPFVILTANLSFSHTETQLSGADAASSPMVGYNAFDLRAGALVGTTLWRLLSPYAVVRAFGGPVYWQYQGANVTGTDAHHYQVGAGLTLVVVHRVDLFVEAIPLGERSLASGAAFAF
ncbi:MAG TPA: hypothetical protein VLA79_01420 [Polyangia bacterium]|nr:hypothetical protein [Polyangia bacterium]